MIQQESLLAETMGYFSTMEDTDLGELDLFALAPLRLLMQNLLDVLEEVYRQNSKAIDIDPRFPPRCARFQMPPLVEDY